MSPSPDFQAGKVGTGSGRRRAELILLSITLVWGGTFAVVKFALSDASPLTFVAIRFGIASLIFPLIYRKNYLKMDRGTLVSGLFLGLLLMIGFAFQTIGLKYTTASKSAFITGLLVAFTPIAQAVIERKMPTKGNLIGVGLVAVGLFFLTSPGGQGLNIGDVLTLVCAISYAIYIVYLDVYSKKYDVSKLTFLQLSETAVLSIVAAPFVETMHVHFTVGFVWALLYTSILATVFATYLQTKYQRETTPVRAAIIFSMEPVLANVIAFFAFGEFVGVIGAFGGVLIVAGLLTSELLDW
ncbi:MAG: DMT family transporter [Bacteroidetes bacterium]|nr:DMT family transporter [Bacteroidota bacterium]